MLLHGLPVEQPASSQEVGDEPYSSNLELDRTTV